MSHTNESGTPVLLLLLAVGCFVLFAGFALPTLSPKSSTVPASLGLFQSVALQPVLHYLSFDSEHAFSEKNGVDHIPGIVGTAVSLDGQNDYIDLGSLELQTGRTFAVSLWYRSKDGEGWIFSEGNTEENISVCGLMVQSDTTEVLCRTGTHPDAKSVVRGVTNINDEAWHFIVFQGEGEQLSVYVDGGLDARVAMPSGRLFVNTTTIGGIQKKKSEGWIAMDIDEVALFDQPLSMDEMQALYTISTPIE